MLLGVATAFVIGILLAISLTQTRWGREQILGYTLATLGGRLNGILTVEEVQGNLFTGARLYGIGLTDMEGVPLALIDSAYMQYRVATFLGGDIVIDRLVVWNADINILKMPGDTIWNYQEILRDPDPEPKSPEDASAVLIARLVLNESRIQIRRPLVPDPRLPPGQREQAYAEELADTARNMIEEVPGGHLIANVIDVDSASLAEVYIGPEHRGGIYLEVEDAVADVRIWRDPPLEIRSLVAQLHLNEGRVNVQASPFQLPYSRGELVGGIDISGDRPMYDLVIHAPQFALTDLRWFFPWLPSDPSEGRGSARVWIEDRPEDLLVLVQDLDLRLPDSHIIGEFGLVTTPTTTRFVNVALEADPVDMDAIGRLLPEGLPVEGFDVDAATLLGTD